MSTYRSRIYKEIITIKSRFHQTSLISKATEIFYACNSLFNYLGKLAQQQGLSFVVGIAVGVNLLLLLQMSEDIVNKLSETSTSTIVGIIAIMATIAFGIAIIYMQRKTNGRINTLSGDHRTFMR